MQLNASPQSDGDWITIDPRPSKKKKYYGASLNQKNAPPKYHIFKADVIVTICFRTRSRVKAHDGFVAEIYQEIGPSTLESPYTADNDYTGTFHDYTNDYISTSTTTTASSSTTTATSTTTFTGN